MWMMTFNIRFENDRDGENGWEYRRDFVTGIIERYAPAVVGTQEGLPHQLTYLKDHLPAYHLHTPARIIDDTSQCPSLFIRADDFSIMEGDEFWLSLQPRVPLSKNWDSAFPRMISAARVTSRGDDRPFWVAVTHLDHVGTEARREQAKMVARWVESRREPVILMGDFNDSPGSAVHRALTDSRTGLVDTWQALGLSEGIENYTSHGFAGVPQKARMDWILATPHFHIVSTLIIRDHFDGRYPSDHFPYMVELER
jgi:endonuclease/exonuclease/phosphatase family metal-dependent hydrolase